MDQQISVVARLSHPFLVPAMLEPLNKIDFESICTGTIAFQVKFFFKLKAK